MIYRLRSKEEVIWIKKLGSFVVLQFFQYIAIQMRALRLSYNLHKLVSSHQISSFL